MKKNNTLEIIFYCLFCVLTIILSVYHEPWFDEFQAWAISKDSLYNILFFLPHYEGHPPLWHLILKCFSCFDFPAELGVKIPNLLFMYGAVWLLIFKSPFSITIRLVLPFTYFIFYQYSVISRPYSILCFALFLVAYFYKTKDEHPFKYMGALALLCLSSAYGMVLTAGICFVWFIEILKEVSFKKVFKDKRFVSIFILFILCCLLAVEIVPASNTFAVAHIVGKDYILRFLSGFFILPADALLTNFFDYMTIYLSDVDFKFFLQRDEFQEVNDLVLNFWLASFVGIFINVLLFCFFKKIKQLCFFAVPYFLFLFISFVLYFHVHHIGLVVLYLIFVFWCVCSTSEIQISINQKRILTVLLVVVISVQLYWSICASYADYRYQYSAGREIYSYIKEKDLFKYKIFANWASSTALLNKNTNKRHIYHIVSSKSGIWKPDKETLKEYYFKSFSFLNHQHLSVLINAYSGKNVFYNFNIDSPSREYLFHIVMSDEASRNKQLKLKSMGLPDVIIDKASIDVIFEDYNVLSKNYCLMESFRCSYIWKNKMVDNEFPIYMRNDLYYEWIKNRYEKSNRTIK